MSDPAIETVPFEEVFELAATARDQGAVFKDRDDATWFKAGEVGAACVWEPGNRASTARISHDWVDEEFEDRPRLLRDLRERALAEAADRGVSRIDTYAYDDWPTDYGFEPDPESSQALDDAEYYVLAGDALDKHRTD